VKKVRADHRMLVVGSGGERPGKLRDPLSSREATQERRWFGLGGPEGEGWRELTCSRGALRGAVVGWSLAETELYSEGGRKGAGFGRSSFNQHSFLGGNVSGSGRGCMKTRPRTGEPQRPSQSAGGGSKKGPQ